MGYLLRQLDSIQEKDSQGNQSTTTLFQYRLAIIFRKTGNIVIYTRILKRGRLTAKSGEWTERSLAAIAEWRNNSIPFPR